MKIEYSKRAVTDLHKIATDSREAFGDQIAEALAARIRKVIDRISRNPLSAPEVENRRGVRVVQLGRYPFKIFYRVFENRVRVQHIRHTARQPWSGL